MRLRIEDNEGTVVILVGPLRSAQRLCDECYHSGVLAPHYHQGSHMAVLGFEPPKLTPEMLREMADHLEGRTDEQGNTATESMHGLPSGT